MNRLLLVGLMCVAMVACSLGSLGAAPQKATDTPASPTATSAPASGLTAEQINNMSVQLAARDSHPTVQLKDGKYSSGSDPASPDYADAKLAPDRMAFGDLNGDGQGDAAALLAENYGGTGVYVSLLAVLNAGGQPVQAGSAMIDDRPAVESVQIKDRQIELDAKVHGPNDPACCASFPVIQTYGLTKNGLTLLRLASRTPDGTQRTIKIEGPGDGAQALAAPLKIKGSYTVAPFENTLAYRVFDGMHNTLAAGPLPVFPGTGSGGTFDTWIDLTAMQAGLLVRIEVADISAADGSTIAMDSIEVMIR